MDTPETAPDWPGLVAAVLACDEASAEELADRLCVRGYGLFRHAGLSVEDAEEQGNNFALRVIARLNQFTGGNFLAWCNRILKHMLIDFCRRRHRETATVPMLDDEADWGAAESAHNGVLTNEEHGALEEALQKLLPQARALIESQTGNVRLPFAEVARELGIKEGSARVYYARAREALEVALRRDERMNAWRARHNFAGS